MSPSYIKLAAITAILLLLIGCGKPPKINQLTGPFDGPINEPQIFTAIAEDPDGDEIQYQFNWGDGKTSAWSALKPSGTAVSDTHSFTTEGEKLIQVQAKDSKGKTSEWSGFKSFFATSGEWSIRRRFIEFNADGESVGFVSTPAVADNGTIYFCCWLGHLHAIDSTGTPIARYTPPEEIDIISSPAIGGDGSVYIGIEDTLFAFNSNLTLKWGFGTNGEISSSPAIGADGTIYFLSDDGNLYSVSDQGQERWRFPAAGGYSSPAVGSDGKIYFGSDDGILYCVNNTGTEKYHFDAAGGINSSPALDNNGNVYFGNEDGTVFCLDTAGNPVWNYPAGTLVSSIVLDENGNSYFGSEAGVLYSRNSAGNERWFFFTGGISASTPAVRRDGTIYHRANFGDDDTLYAVSSGGDRLWAVSIKNSDVDDPVPSPTIADNGTVFISGGDALYGLVGASGGAANSAWPMFRHDRKHTGRIPGLKFIGKK